jgi:superfamily II DNA helicase RecQ
VSFAFFCISAAHPELEQQTLNDFCTQNAIINIEKQFVMCGVDSFWSICVTARDSAERLPSIKEAVATKVPIRNKVDYKDVLPPADFERYVALRELRKQLAIEASVPVYGVMTNDQMAQCAQKQPLTLEALGTISGLGEARLRKYGAAILVLLTAVSS